MTGWRAHQRHICSCRRKTGGDVFHRFPITGIEQDGNENRLIGITTEGAFEMNLTSSYVTRYLTR